jgi:hypothetical protein
MAVEKFWTSNKPSGTVSTHVGRIGEIFYDPTTGDLRLHDGTPGGYRLLAAAAGTYIGDGSTIDITEDQVVSVINLPTTGHLGPIEGLLFDTDHVDETVAAGSVTWSNKDDTLNIHHTGGPVQQVGQESYAYVKNATGSTITDGTSVYFSGASNGGSEPRLEVSPFLANGAYPSLYTLGITTQSIAPGDMGRVTVWGKVRDINTTGHDGETWNIGDILYASPATAGNLTNVKPTAPDNVVPMAAVLKVDASAGELFVRPTVSQKMNYGVFTKTTNEAFVANTPEVIDFDKIEIANGVSVVSNTQLTTSQSGLFQIDWTLHFVSSGNQNDEDIWYSWLRKNGTDVQDTMRRGGIDGESPNETPTFTRVLSMDANDYIEVVVAVNNARVSLEYSAAMTTPFVGPATAAAEITIAQIQL